MHMVLKGKEKRGFKGMFYGFSVCWAMVGCPVEVLRRPDGMPMLICFAAYLRRFPQ